MAEKDPEEMSRKQEWKDLIRALAVNFLGSFPSQQDLPWAAIHETIRLTEVQMSLLGQVATLPQAAVLFGADGLGKDIFLRLLKTCMTLDAWMDVQVPSDPGYPTPEELQSKVLEVCVLLIRCLGGNGIADPEDSTITNWNVQRSFLDGCLRLCEGK